ncbi:MAG: hypothetical protein ABIQ18_05225 [Umezawaea sp.]
MRGPGNPRKRGQQHNSQVNRFSGKGPSYAIQGGQQEINNYTTSGTRSRTGWVLGVLVGGDTAFFTYLMVYNTEITDDEVKQVVGFAFVALIWITRKTYRKWVRDRQRR